MKRTLCTLFVLAVIAIVPTLNGIATAGAKTRDAGDVTVFATCFEATASDPAQVEVAIDNNGTGPIVVSYVHGFTTGPAMNPKFIMKEPGNSPTYEVEPGDRFWVWAPWDDLRESADEIGGVLVVTNVGLIVTGCDGESSGLVQTGGTRGAGVDQVGQELATIAAETIGQLEAWHAYPALYALLHPDAQAVVSFEAVSCWYVSQYGLPDSWKASVFSTNVQKTSLGPWTYAVTGDTYDTAAEVTFSQKIGTMSKSSLVDGVEHLVPFEGQYRWFFGLDAAAVAAQPDNCDLGNN